MYFYLFVCFKKKTKITKLLDGYQCSKGYLYFQKQWDEIYLNIICGFAEQEIVRRTRYIHFIKHCMWIQIQSLFIFCIIISFHLIQSGVSTLVWPKLNCNRLQDRVSFSKSNARTKWNCLKSFFELYSGWHCKIRTT